MKKKIFKIKFILKKIHIDLYILYQFYLSLKKDII